MGNQQNAREMLECFCNSIPGLIEALHGHVAAADQAATLATIQRILSIATSSSVISIQNCALQMEHAAKMDNMESLREIMPLLEQKSVEAIETIKEDNFLFGSNLADIV